MRRLLLLCGLAAVLCQHPATRLEAQTAQEQNSETNDATAKWRLINSGIFALLLGYAAIKFGPRFFNARSSDIQKAIKEATGLKIEADFRYSEVDKKMATLDKEVEKLRVQATAEMEREHQRMRQQTAEEIEHIHKNGEAEINSLEADGIRQVRQHTIQLAMGLAERRLQTRFAEGSATDNLREFVDLVERGKN